MPGNTIVTPATATAEHFEMGYGDIHFTDGFLRQKRQEATVHTHPGEQPNPGALQV